MVLDFKHNRRHAIVRGFWRGMAAPASLFVVHSAPAVAQIEQVKPPRQTTAGALASDWRRVGKSMNKAIERHEQQENNRRKDG
jgi:hypothetical protein